MAEFLSEVETLRMHLENLKQRRSAFLVKLREGEQSGEIKDAANK